jgi:4-hydroxybenzoate polyprenyltransferase
VAGKPVSPSAQNRPMPPSLARQLVEFGRTIKLSHTLFALPFALGTAVLADPPCPGAWALVLMVACMVTARTAAMGMNRLADAAFDARNPRTADRAIPAGRLARRTAALLTAASAAAFLALAWGFYPLATNPWPGLLAPAFLAVLLVYSLAKRVTALTHWVLGLSLGLAPVGAWVALRGGWLIGGEVDALTAARQMISPVPLAIGAGVMFWTAGFDILYALQDMAVDRRERLRSIPARLGPVGARIVSAASHGVAIALLVAASRFEAADPRGTGGPAMQAAIVVIGAALAVQHVRAWRRTPEAIAAAFFPLNAAVSIIWFAAVVVDAAWGLGAK